MPDPIRITNASEIENQRLRRLYEYWDEKRAGRRAPARSEIDPTEIPDLLGYVNLLDVQDNPRDYRVRLHGTEVTRMMGREVTGKWCSEFFVGADADCCRRAFAIVVEEWTPALAETSLAFCGKPYTGQTLVAVPLSADGRRVDSVIVAHSYHAFQARGEIVPFREASEF